MAKLNLTDTNQAWMVLFSGRKINLLDLHEDDIDINDIAHALSLVNRFGGHSVFPINVAVHSVWVSRVLDGTGWELDALLHDGSEAYLGDMIKWIKRLPEMAPFRSLEELIQTKINRKFGCRMKYATSASVRGADDLLVRYEATMGYPHVHDFFDGTSAYPPIQASERKLLRDWEPVGPAIAEVMFLERFERVKHLAGAT